MQWLLRSLVLLVVLVALGVGFVHAQPAIQPAVDITRVPAAAQPSAHFSADAATEAYMAMMPAAAIARSNAYFEGGYWLILWDFLYSSALCILLLQTRWSARMRDLAERITRFKWLQTFLYWAQYLLLVTLLGFPLEFYENYVREHKYGLATQSFWPWMGDEAKALAGQPGPGRLGRGFALRDCAQAQKHLVDLGLGGRAGRLAVVAIAITPVYLTPIFNKVTRLNDPKVTAPILSMAHANGIPTNDVYEIDASRQTTRMSANVSGFANTMRITLNDNLLRRGTPEEIQAVMGHEMGHYVMNHIPKDILFLFIVIVASFAYLRWALGWTLARWGERWQIHSIGDPAVLPLVLLLAGVLFFVLTPIMNTQTRTQEKEADMFGTERCAPARWIRAGRHPPRRIPQDAPRTDSKSSSSSTIPAATTASTPPWSGKPKIFSSSKSTCRRPHAHQHYQIDGWVFQPYPCLP